MTDKYILIGQTPVPEPDLLTWARWFETAERHVGDTTIGSVRVSTVFMGLDHRFGDGPPLLFETMIFSDGDGEESWRCSTWLEAEAQHAAAVKRVQSSQSRTTK